MEIRLVTSEELRSLETPIPNGYAVIAFKMVQLGPNTLAEAEFNGKKICEIADQQGSFFIISESADDLRSCMHQLVDQFCDARKG